MEIVLKICRRCNTEKPLSDFSKRSSNNSGYGSDCKECHNELSREWQANHREQCRKSTRKWHENNKEKSKITSKLWLSKNYEKKRTYIKKWNKEHPDKVKEMARRGALKTRSTLRGRINDAFSSSIYRSIKSEKNNNHWENLVGYTIEDLKKHIEKQFKPGMSWENYGKYTWHIDHKIPVAAFNFTCPSDLDFKKCWALSNLQPLEAKKNHGKKDRLLHPFQPSLLIQEVESGTK